MHRRTPPRLRALAALVSALLPLAVLPLGCSSPDPTGSGGADPTSTTGSGTPDAGTQPVTVTLDPGETPLPGESACTVVEVTNIAVPDAHHIVECTPQSYATNPPSGGPHWPVWAAQGKYTTPIPRELYTHNLEHGWVVLSYRCQDGCPDVVAALGKAVDAADDTYCVSHGSPASRVILTPDPLLDTPIAASAWGATYTATCIDAASIADFIARRLGHGTEMICGGGQDPALVEAVCISSGSDAGTDGGS